MTSLSLNAAIAQNVFQHSVIWLAGPDNVESPYIMNLSKLGGGESWHSMDTAPVPDYSGDWKHCALVISKMHDRGFAFMLKRDPESLFLGGFGRNGVGMVFAEDTSPTVAICMGALRVIGVEIGG